jgi:hypothetical protein
MNATKAVRSSSTTMSMKPDGRDVAWMAVGAAFLLLLAVVVYRFYEPPNPAKALAFKATRLDLVDSMRTGLASASEAEKSAVLAVTDEESQAFADRARAATAAVDDSRKRLGDLLAGGGPPHERDLLERFATSFDELRRVDAALLDLAVKNTNVKAAALASGPAAEAMTRIDEALSRLASTAGVDGAPRLALGAVIAARRIQAVLPSHIAEGSDTKMDALEAGMVEQERQVGADLDGLDAMGLAADTDLTAARSAWRNFLDLKAQIVTLSRENTNVRSLAISLGDKRKALLLCLDALNALQHAIESEPIAGVDYGPPARPR